MTVEYYTVDCWPCLKDLHISNWFVTPMLCYLFSNNCIKFSALSAHFAISILHISHMASGDPFYSTSNMLSYYHCYADHHSMFVNQKIFFLQATFWYWQDCCAVQIRETSCHGGWRIQDTWEFRGSMEWFDRISNGNEILQASKSDVLYQLILLVEEIAVPLAGHSYHRSHCFHCKDSISHHSSFWT